MAFKKDAAASELRDWSLMNADLTNFHTCVHTSPSALSKQNSRVKVANNPKSSQVCNSQNAGECRWPLVDVIFANSANFAVVSASVHFSKKKKTCLQSH